MPQHSSAATAGGWARCVDIVSLGKLALSTSRTRWPLCASSIAVGEPPQRAPTTIASYSVLICESLGRGPADRLTGWGRRQERRRNIARLMSFTLDLTDEQQELRASTHAFARDVIRPAAPEYDRAQELPWPILQEAARQGLYKWELYAELSVDPTGLSLPILMEELFWGCAGIGLSIVMPALALAAIRQAATDEQLARWAPECFGTPDDIKLAALAVTEPSGGSDIRSIQTRARKDGGDWVIDGQKVFIGNGGIADVHVVVHGRSRGRSPRPGGVHRAEGHTRAHDAAEARQARLPRLPHRRDPFRGVPRAGRPAARRRRAAPGPDREGPGGRAGHAGARDPCRGGRPRGRGSAPQLGCAGRVRAHAANGGRPGRRDREGRARVRS